MPRSVASPESDTPAINQYVVAAAITFIAALPSLYRASATVLIEGHLAEAQSGDTVEDRLEAIRQEALTRARLSDLIEQFDLYPALRRNAPPEAVMDRLERDITIKPITSNDRSGVPNTIAFSVDYLGLDRDKVATVANALASS